MFDLDNTLLGGDSDYLWGMYLCECGVLDSATYARANAQFYADYQAGTLDINAFLQFALAPLAAHTDAELEAWRAGFMREKIAPILQPAAHQLLAKHRAQGDTLLIVTATNRFITAPIAEAFGVEHLIATELERANGRFTGAICGEPTFRDGKVTHLMRWLEAHAATLEGSYFYSDSINDQPLLDTVTYPVAVDPDEQLAALARERHWPIISLRAAS